MYNSQRSCPICKGNQSEVLRQMYFQLPDGHPLSGGYPVVCCSNCGFVYADTIVGQKEYDLFYKKYSKYEDHQTSTGSGISDWDNQRFVEIVSLISSYLPDTRLSILDIGCANGGLLNIFRQKGYSDLYGIDPSANCVSNVMKLGIPASTGTILSHHLQTSTFDCVILSHVLEHVQELKEGLDKIFPLVKPTGFIYVEIPDATRYKDFIFSPFQDFNTEHINHFSLQSLSNLFSDWNVIDKGQKTIMSAPDMPYPAIYSLFSKNNGTSCYFSKDTDLKIYIQEYIECSQKLLNEIDTKILNTIKKTHHQIIIWGVGQLTMKLLAESCLKDIQVAAFVDGNPINQGKLIMGKSVLSPDQIREYDFPILISSILHGKEIANHIQSLGLKNPIITL